MDYTGVFCGLARSYSYPIVNRHKHTTYRLYVYFRGEIEDALKKYLDFYGQKFIAVNVPGHPVYHVNLRHAEDTCADLLSVDSEILAKRSPNKYEIEEIPMIRFAEYYLNAIPKHLQALFSLHGIIFTQCEHAGRKYYVYEKSTGKYTDKPSLYSSCSETVSIECRNINLQDFYVDDSSFTTLRPYLQLLDIKMVPVTHNGTTHHIPIQFLNVVARRLGLFA